MPTSAAKRIVVALLWSSSGLVMQLRDFKHGIDDPGQWGLFGGHLTPKERPEAGLVRELIEEIGCVPQHIDPLGHFDEPDRRIIGFSAVLEIPIDRLVVREGHDVGVFAADDLKQGSLFSQRCQQSFPMTPITRRALALWAGLAA